MRKYILFISFFIFGLSAFADSVIVYGEGFSFSLKIPLGWECSCDGIEAAKIGANALLFKKGETWQKANALIFLRVNGAPNDKVQEDIQADMKGYKEKHASVVFKELKVKHPKYKVASKLFEIPNISYEYVTYLAPRPFPGKSISVAMNIQKRKAKVDELKAYEEVIESTTWLTEFKK